MQINEILNVNLDDLFLEEILEEGAIRQVRRYGNKMKMQYRCQGGEKDGKLVSQPSGCGIRKNPNRVRSGQKSARIKKEQRVRKTKFTKKKTLSQILVRRNKMMKGATADKVTEKNDKVKSDNITTSGTKGTE